jgi:hypothetical protein
MNTIKFKDLEKGKIYYDIVDKKVPLMFTGKFEKIVDLGLLYYIVYFKPVETKINKNWLIKKDVPIKFNVDGENNRIINKTI